MSIISFAGRKESLERVVAGKDEASEVDQEATSKVKEDEEEVQAAETEDHVDLRDTGLLLEIVEDLIFRELSYIISKLAQGSAYVWIWCHCGALTSLSS